MSHLSHVTLFFFFFFFEKMLELIGGVSVINRAYPTKYLSETLKTQSFEVSAQLHYHVKPIAYFFLSAPGWVSGFFALHSYLGPSEISVLCF